jgi:hypothetical protein
LFDRQGADLAKAQAALSYLLLDPYSGSAECGFYGAHPAARFFFAFLPVSRIMAEYFVIGPSLFPGIP